MKNRVNMVIAVILFVISAIYAGTALAANAKQTEKWVEQIRQRYATINTNQGKYRKVELTNDETGDTFITSYFEGKQLRKTDFGSYAGNQGTEQEYYFWNGRLIFLFHRFSDKGARRENRFYLHNGRLIRWLDKNKESVPSSSARFRQYERKLQTSERFWLRNAENPNRIGNNGSTLHEVFLTIE